METKRIIILALGCMLLFSLPIVAQRTAHRHHGPGTHHPVKRKVIKAHRFHKNKVVVVKPRRITTLALLPVGHSVFVFKEKKYFHHQGVFYYPLNAGYTIVLPPPGIRLKVLPPAYKKIVVANTSYFYCSGVYYKQQGEEYEVVEPLVGAIVPELPEDNVEQVTIEGVAYYELDEVLYKTVDTEEGKQYEVVGRLEV